MSKLTDLGIVISNVVGTMSAAELAVSNTKYQLSVKCDVADSLAAYDEVYLVQGGSLFAMDGSNLRVQEADIGIRHKFPANKYVKAISAEGVTSEVFDIAVAAPLASVSFDWTPLVALVKEGVTTYEYGDVVRVHTSATVLHQAAIESVHVAAAEGTNTVTFVLDSANADKVVTGEEFAITLSAGTFRGLVTADKEVVIEDQGIADLIRATAQGGPLSFSHFLQILGNITFDFAVSPTTPTTAGFSVVKPVLALTSAGLNLVTETKGAMHLGIGLTHRNEQATGDLRCLEAYLKDTVKTVRVAYDINAYHMGGGVLNILWGADLSKKVVGTLVADGATTWVEISNDLLYDFILASATDGEAVNLRMFVTPPAVALPAHYTVLETGASAPIADIPHGDNAIQLLFDADSADGVMVYAVNPDMATTSEDILAPVKATKLGVVTGADAKDQDAIVFDVEGANIGDVLTLTPIHTTVKDSSHPVTLQPFVGIKRRGGYAFTGAISDWAAMFRAIANGDCGAVTAYSAEVSPRVEYDGMYDVTVGNNGNLYGYSALFGAINKNATDQALGYANVGDATDVIAFADITEVTSNGTSVTFGLHDSAIMVTGKTVILRRSTDESQVFRSTIVRTVAGKVSASFGPDLAFTLANEYSDGSIFSFDLAFEGVAKAGEVLVQTDAAGSGTVVKTYGTADNANVKSVAVTAENTEVTLKAASVPAHSVYVTNYLKNGQDAASVSNVVGNRNNVVAYPDVGLRTAISQAVYSALNVVALPLGNNAIKVSRTTTYNGEAVDEVTYGYNATQGAIYYTGLVIDGKFDADAKIISVEYTTKELNSNPARAGEPAVIANRMRVDTAGLEAVGKTVTLTIDGGVATGTLREVDGSPFLEVTLAGDEFWAAFTATPEDQWIPLSIDFEGTPTLVVPQVMLEGGGSTTLPYSKIAGEETGTITIDENLPQNGLDNLLSIRVTGDDVLITTSYPSGTVFILDKVDGISVPGSPISVKGIVDGTGRVEFTNAALAALMAGSHDNTVVFDVRVTLGNHNAAYQVTMGTVEGSTDLGYSAGVMGNINTNILAGQEDKFNVNRAVLITDVICTDDDVFIKLNETAIQQVGRTVKLVSVYSEYTGTIVVEGGVPTVRFGALAHDEVSLYPVGFLFGFDLEVTGEGTAFIGDQVMRVKVGTGEDAFVANAQEAPITDPGYIVKTQDVSGAMAVKQIVARNDGRTVRLVLS